MLSRIAGVFAALLIAFAVLVICDMVVERYLLGRTTIWQIDVVTYCIMAATSIGSAFVLMTRGHVNVDVLPLHVGKRASYWLALTTILIALAFCVVLFTLCTVYWYECGRRTGAPTRCDGHGSGFLISQCRSDWVFWCCNVSANF